SRILAIFSSSLALVIRFSHFLISRQYPRCSLRTDSGRVRKHLPQMISLSPSCFSLGAVRRHLGLMQGIRSLILPTYLHFLPSRPRRPSAMRNAIVHLAAENQFAL